MLPRQGEGEFKSHTQESFKYGELAEWSIAVVLKTIERGNPLRGFESLTLRKLRINLGVEFTVSLDKTADTLGLLACSDGSNPSFSTNWKVGRVAECGSFENYLSCQGHRGSNPLPSADGFKTLRVSSP